MFYGAKYSEQEFPKILGSFEVGGYLKNGGTNNFVPSLSSIFWTVFGEDAKL